MSTDSRQPLLAGVDVGTTSTKAVIYSVVGDLVSRAERPTPAGAEALRRIALEVLRDCVAAAGRAPDVIGVTSMAETGALLDDELQPVGDLLSWQDPRGAAHADELRRVIGERTIFDATGLHISAKLPLVKWRWVAEQDPGAFRQGQVWAGAAELAVSAMCGIVRSDATLAGRTGAYDIATGCYIADLLDWAGLGRTQLPEVVPARTVAANVNADGARQTGVAEGTPVVIAGHDHLAASYAAGVRGSGQAADSLGTAEAVVTVTDGPRLQLAVLDAAISVGRYLDGQHYCMISGLPSSGALIDWFLDVAGHSSEGRYEWLEQAMRGLSGEPSGILVQPYLAGRAAPQPDPNRRLDIRGLGPQHTFAHLARALIEGTCLHVRWMIESQAHLAGVTPADVVAIGGPCRSATWMAVKAAITPAALRVCHQTAAAAAGAAFLAGEAIGVSSSDCLLPTVAVDTPAELRAGWDSFYRTVFLPAATSKPPAISEEPPSA